MSSMMQRSKDKGVLPLHYGQTKAWDSTRRFVFVIAGTQGGKTSFGPWWLAREIEQNGEGDYLAVSANYDLFKLKMLPEMKLTFCDSIGGWEWHASDRIFTKGASRIILRSANAVGGLESSTAKAAWLDECGHPDFELDAWEAVLRRLSLHQGRVLGTTTIYNMGWLKSEVYDRWQNGDQDFQVIQFKSTMNPLFPKAEYERARATMASWKFLMMYDAVFSRPAGMIYDAFNDELCYIPPFEVNREWARYGGLDFGGVNTAALCYVEDPGTKVLYLTREYLGGNKSIAEHAAELKTWGCRLWVGGSWSEEQWRTEFQRAGLPITEPSISEVEVGIDRVYACHKTNGIMVFNTCKGYRDQKMRYARKLDDTGQPTQEIENKRSFHYMDAERYIIGKIRGTLAPMTAVQPTQKSKFLDKREADEVSRWKRY